MGFANYRFVRWFVVGVVMALLLATPTHAGGYKCRGCKRRNPGAGAPNGFCSNCKRRRLPVMQTLPGLPKGGNRKLIERFIRESERIHYGDSVADRHSN